MEKIQIKNKVIVFGSSHHNTLGLVRSLGEAGISPYLVLVTKYKDSFVAKSKYLADVIFVNNSKEGLDVIVSKFKDAINKSIIFCSNDDVARIIDANYDCLKDCFFVQNAKASNVILPYFDKFYLTDKAKEWGFDVPYSVILSKDSVLSDQIPFPCITKPIESIKGKKADIIVCYNRKELESVLEKLFVSVNNVLVQEYIEKDYEISILGLSLESQILLPGIIKKIREYPYKKGSSSFACLMPFPSDLNLEPLYKAIKKVGYTGLFSVEFVKRGNKYYFLEINFRNDGNGYVITSAGMNQPYIYCLDVLGLWDGLCYNNVNLPHFFMSENTDLYHIVEKRLSFYEWYKDYKKVNCYLRYNKSDLVPTNGHVFSIMFILSFIKKYFYAVIRKNNKYM